jgi:RNA polymerase sigma-70 factor, ECF subfamily
MREESTSRRSEIAELYTRFGPMVLGRCRWLLRNDEAARDAAQEVFVKVMRSLDGFRAEASPSTWILKIATNHCLNLIAADRALWKDRYKTYVATQEEGGFLQGVDPMRARLVQQLLDKLDPETQAVAVHYWVDEMTQEEIAAATGRSLPTIRKRLEKFKRIAEKELSHERS